MGNGEDWEWVRPSWRNGGYYRRVARTRQHPTIHQREFRYAASKAGREVVRQTGLVEYQGKLVPPMAAKVAEKLKGRKFAPSKPKQVPEVLMRLKPALEDLGKAVESLKPINRDLIPQLLLWQRLRSEKKKRSRVTA